jgi:hypothetical protein
MRVASSRGLKKETRKQKILCYVEEEKQLSVTYHGLFLHKKNITDEIHFPTNAIALGTTDPHAAAMPPISN